MTRSVAYAYTNGDLTSITTPSGQTITYGYNANHQVTSIAANGTTVLSNVSYEPFGPVDGWTWGNGTSFSRSFNGDGLIAGISSPGSQESFGYDDASRISGITNTAPGSSSFTYGYDVLDRVTSATSSSATHGWTYDADGNRLSETGASPSTYSISSASNEITGITGSLARTYAYDAAGNTLSDAQDTDTYNDAGRLKTLTNTSGTTTFVYNALGQMIEASGPSGTTLYVYDQAGHLAGEYDGSGNLIQETVWLGDIPVATLRPSGSSIAIYYVVTDQVDTPREVIRPSDNALMWSWFSGPFGAEAPNTNPQGVGTFTYDLRLPGQIAGTWGSTLQNDNRDYDPAVGRFIESDQMGLSGGSFSTYAYVASNPLAFIDPLGLAQPCGNDDRCSQLRKQIFEKAAKLINELQKYNPIEDARGGFWTPWGLTVPGGHYQEIQDLQRGLKNDIADYKRLCSNNNDRWPPVPRSIDEAANREVEEPVITPAPDISPASPGTQNLVVPTAGGLAILTVLGALAF